MDENTLNFNDDKAKAMVKEYLKDGPKTLPLLIQDTLEKHDEVTIRLKALLEVAASASQDMDESTKDKSYLVVTQLVLQFKIGLDYVLNVSDDFANKDMFEDVDDNNPPIKTSFKSMIKSFDQGYERMIAKLQSILNRTVH